MIKFIAQAVIVAVLGGCSSHMALMAMDKQADNQQHYIDEYEAEMSEMEAKDYE